MPEEQRTQAGMPILLEETDIEKDMAAVRASGWRNAFGAGFLGNSDRSSTAPARDPGSPAAARPGIRLD
jgi:hypothetical protein